MEVADVNAFGVNTVCIGKIVRITIVEFNRLRFFEVPRYDRAIFDSFFVELFLYFFYAVVDNGESKPRRFTRFRFFLTPPTALLTDFLPSFRVFTSCRDKPANLL